MVAASTDELSDSSSVSSLIGSDFSDDRLVVLLLVERKVGVDPRVGVVFVVVVVVVIVVIVVRGVDVIKAFEVKAASEAAE